MKVCPRCSTNKEDTEFTRRRGTQLSGWCKACNNDRNKLRSQKLKEDAVSFMGGKCNHCAVVGHTAIYDFHHVDPREKDFAISKSRASTLTETLMDELSKCILLCANFHRVEHATY